MQTARSLLHLLQWQKRFPSATVQVVSSAVRISTDGTVAVYTAEPTWSLGSMISYAYRHKEVVTVEPTTTGTHSPDCNSVERNSAARGDKFDTLHALFQRQNSRTYVHSEGRVDRLTGGPHRHSASPVFSTRPGPQTPTRSNFS